MSLVITGLKDMLRKNCIHVCTYVGLISFIDIGGFEGSGVLALDA